MAVQWQPVSRHWHCLVAVYMCYSELLVWTLDIGTIMTSSQETNV